MKAERNDPCPCGSGKKYKKCHLPEDTERESRALAIARATERGKARELPPEVLAEWKRRSQADKERRERQGDVRQVIHADFQDHKFVAVGGTLHWSRKWKTFIDFLQDYIKKVMTANWGDAELAKVPDEQHIVIRWYQQYCEFQKKPVANEEGIKEGVPDGPSLAYLTLAYDLYVLADHALLQEKLVARLRHRDQFQGARYELAVAATMIRAGFALEHEDEANSTTKHPEFVAIDKASGERIAVEAKSRHRTGILGRAGNPVDRENFRLGINDLLKRAIAKRGTLPFLVFIDANMPPEVAIEDQKTWLAEFAQALSRVGHGYNEFGVFEGAPFSGLVLTNWAEHYGEGGQPYPQSIGMISWPWNPVVPFGSNAILTRVETAVKQYGNIPSRFPE
jgi:hypothetical protein